MAAYAPVARAFASAQVDLIDDSGPPMVDPYFAGCLQDLQRQTWGLDSTLIHDCGGECATAGTQLFDLYKRQIKTHPAASFGQVESTDDNTTTSYFGFGLNSCTGYQQLSEAQFIAGLGDMESRLSSYANAGAFVWFCTHLAAVVRLLHPHSGRRVDGRWRVPDRLGRPSTERQRHQRRSLIRLENCSRFSQQSGHFGSL